MREHSTLILAADQEPAIISMLVLQGGAEVKTSMSRAAEIVISVDKSLPNVLITKTTHARDSSRGSPLQHPLRKWNNAMSSRLLRMTQLR